MAPPVLGDEQINCGPWFTDQKTGGRWLTRNTPFGSYDVTELSSLFSPNQYPDVVVCHVDCGFCLKPRNLSVFRCPVVLLAADSHWGDRAVSALIRYALSEPFARTIVVYDRHHADLYRAAGVQNVHWFPGLTFAHPDSRIAAATGQVRLPHLALVGKTGYHFFRQRTFAALIAARLPLAWKEIRQSEAIAFYGKSLIGFNASMNGDLNLRVFETLAGGAMLLTDRLSPSAGLDDLLAEGREKISYRDTDELVALARHYLGHPGEAAEIGAAGRRWFEQNFTNERRRKAFAAIVADNRSEPLFALPEKTAYSFAPGRLSLDSALVAYDFVNERHRHASKFTVRMDSTVPPEWAAILASLPRVNILDTSPEITLPVDLDVCSLHSSAPMLANAAQARWFWDATPAHQVTAETIAAKAGLNLCETGAALFYTPPKPPTPAQTLALEAQKHLEFGDVEGALSRAKSALAGPNPPAASLLVMAELAIEVGNRALFDKMLSASRRSEPTLPRIELVAWTAARQNGSRQHLRLMAGGWKAYESLDFATAARYATRALTACADLPEAHFLLSLVHAHEQRRAGDPASARKHIQARLSALQQACALAPNHPEYVFHLALAAREGSDVDAAIESTRRLLAIEPDHIPAFMLLGEQLIAQEKPGEAASVLKQGLSISPTHTALQQLLRLAELMAAKNPFLTAVDRRLGIIANPSFPDRISWKQIIGATPDIRCMAPIAGAKDLSYKETVDLLICAGKAGIESAMPLPAIDGKPIHIALLTHQPWFDLDVRRVITAASERGITVILLDATTPFHSPVTGLTPADFRQACHRKISLWEISHYRIALELRTLPQDIDASIAHHAAVIKEQFLRAAGFIDQAYAYCAYYRPKSVIIAQGYDLADATLRAVAVRSGIRVVALENTFNRDRLLWDDTSGIAVHRNLAKSYFWRYVQALPAGAADRTAEIYLATLGSLKTAQHASPLISTSTLPRPDGRVTLAYIGQVGVDSAVLFGLRGFSSQIEVISALAHYAAAHNCSLLVKLHPKESPTYADPVPYYRGLTQGWLERHGPFQAARVKLGEHLIIDTDNIFNTAEIIRRADVCVTINSQAGLEAALLEREVVLCGNAFYGQLGFTHEVSDEPSLTFTLNRILRDGLRLHSTQLVRSFFHIFSELYCLPKSCESVVRLMAGRPDFPPVPANEHSRFQPDLIYDVGMNNGDDTAYYLQLGYRVVAIEADPDLCAAARIRFEKEIADRRLIIVNMGVADRPGSLEFWICDTNRVWNSFDRKIASRDGLPHHAIHVPCQTFQWMVEHHGIPRILKVDIEGHDHYCLEALATLDDLPEYLSFEIGDIDHFISQLEPLGYTEFKCISQYNFLPLQLPPSSEQAQFERGDPTPTRRQKSWIFPEGSSGPVGENTPGRWLTSAEVRAVYAHYAKLAREGLESPFWFGKSYSFWVDLHARRTPLPQSEAGDNSAVDLATASPTPPHEY